MRILSGIKKSRYDALTFLFRRRMPRMTVQAHYTLAGAYSYGGSTGNRSGAGLAMDYDKPFADSEWGPNGPDERHRFVFTGVLEAPYGVQLSPVVQLASARAYNLTAGSDLNADGNNNDRWVDPATGKQVSINAARGDNTFVFDLRTTKFIPFGGDRRLGIFVEFFNLFNTANFGAQYNGNGRSSAFRTPTGTYPASATRGRCNWGLGSTSRGRANHVSSGEVSRAGRSQTQKGSPLRAALCVFDCGGLPWASPQHAEGK